MKYMPEDDIKNFNNIGKLLEESIAKEERGEVGLTTSVSLDEMKEMLNWVQYNLSLYKIVDYSKYMNSANVEAQTTTELDINEVTNDESKGMKR